MGAYVRKSCYGSMGKKLLCMHPPLNEFDQLGGFFFLMSLLFVGSPRRRTGEET